MMFWIAILAGAMFVWLAVRMGFYETWVLLFNTIISIYVSVFCTPILAEIVPASGGASSYHTALCMIALAGGCFAILQGLSYVFLTGQFHISFPQVFDVVLSGVVGFLAGFLMLSFVGLVLTTTPLAEHKIAGVFALPKQSQQANGPQAQSVVIGNPNLSCLTWCCGVIHSFAGFHDAGSTTQMALQKLLDTPHVSPISGPEQTDVNKPPQPRPPKSTTRRLNRYLDDGTP